MRLQAIEGLRGTAAIVVVTYHLAAAHILFQQEWLRWSTPLLDFFFVLSGFVMALGFGDRVKDARSFWSFWIRRAGRLWPMHLAMIVLLLSIPLARMSIGENKASFEQAFSGVFDLQALVTHVGLAQIWRPDTLPDWNFPSWTMSAELPAYVLMTFMCLIATRRRTRWLIALGILSIAIPPFLTALAQTEPPYNVMTPPRAIVGFFIGFLLYDVSRWFPLRAAFAHVGEIVSLAAFVGVLFAHFTGPLYLINYAACAFVIYVFAAERGVLSRAFSTAPMLWLGKVSLSVYLFHGVLWLWILEAIRFIGARVDVPLMGSAEVEGFGVYTIIDLPGAWDNVLLVAYLAVILTAAHFFYRYIETPSRDVFNAWARRVEGKTTAAKASVVDPARATT